MRRILRLGPVSCLCGLALFGVGSNSASAQFNVKPPSQRVQPAQPGGQQATSQFATQQGQGGSTFKILPSTSGGYVGNFGGGMQNLYNRNQFNNPYNTPYNANPFYPNNFYPNAFNPYASYGQPYTMPYTLPYQSAYSPYGYDPFAAALLSGVNPFYQYGPLASPFQQFNPALNYGNVGGFNNYSMPIGPLGAPGVGSNSPGLNPAWNNNMVPINSAPFGGGVQGLGNFPGFGLPNR